MSLPFSFVYYPVNFFGIGLTIESGAKIDFILGYMPYFIDAENKIKIINKFGNFDKKKYFLIEYGLLNTIKCYFLHPELPNIFFGYDTSLKNSLNIAIRGIFEFSYNTDFEQTENYEIKAGAEIRIRYSYSKKYE
jgi:hypothetical protein